MLITQISGDGKMKKAVSFLMAVVMVLSLCSCKLIPTPSSSVETVEEYEEFEYYEGKNKDKNKNNSSKPKGSSNKEETDEDVDAVGDSDDSNENTTQSGGEDNTVTGSGSSGGNNQSGNKIEEELPLNLKGKTVTLAVSDEVPYGTVSFAKMINDFEAKYNCTVKDYQLSFGTFNQGVKNMKSKGDPYDIIYVHGSKFPEGPQLGLYADLTEYLYREDTSNFDMDKTNSFKWGVRTYGICNTYSAYPYIFYYNKALFDKAGLEDPRTLYNQGIWTWDKIFSMGATATKSAANIYFLSSNVNHTNFYGVSSITVDNGKVHLNLHDEKTTLSLKLIQKIYCETGIGKQFQTGDSLSEFIAGQNYMFVDDSSKYPDIWGKVKKETRKMY
jgi:ABC-type glycerol-3-phosphate transport system substrate-binding protein